MLMTAWASGALTPSPFSAARNKGYLLWFSSFKVYKSFALFSHFTFNSKFTQSSVSHLAFTLMSSLACIAAVISSDDECLDEAC